MGSPGTLPGAFVAACGGRPAVLSIEKFHDAYKDGALDMSVAGFGAVAAYSPMRGFYSENGTVPIRGTAAIPSKYRGC